MKYFADQSGLGIVAVVLLYLLHKLWIEHRREMEKREREIEKRDALVAELVKSTGVMQDLHQVHLVMAKDISLAINEIKSLRRMIKVVEER